MTRIWTLVGACGVLFVVCFVVGAAVQGDIPTYDDGGEAIADWYADNWREYLIGDFIIGLGFILFYFPFLVGLYARLRAADGEPAVFSRVALLGGILLPVAGLVGAVLNAALALLEGDVSPEVAATVSAAAFHTYVSLGGILTVFLGGAAIVILRSKAFWAWLGWLAAAIALVGILGSAASIENNAEGALAIVGMLDFVVFGVWVLGVSAAMLRSEEPRGSGA